MKLSNIGKRPTKLTRAQAEAQGFAVDTHCYPWFGYKGPRFAPTERVQVFTDTEAETIAALETARNFVKEVSEKTGFGQAHTLKVIEDTLKKVKS